MKRMKKKGVMTPELVGFTIISLVMAILLLFLGIQFFRNLSAVGDAAKENAATYAIVGALFIFTLVLLVGMVVLVYMSRYKSIIVKEEAQATNLTELTVAKAARNETDEIVGLYNEIIDHISTRGNYPCWTKGAYPAEPFVSASVEAGTAYIVRSGEEVVGSFTLSECDEETYDLGRWHRQLKRDEYLVIHALAVSPKYQGRGIAGYMVKFAVKQAAKSGYKAVRADCTLLNYPAMELFEKLGFQSAGAVDLKRNISGARLFQLYEYNID